MIPQAIKYSIWPDGDFYEQYYWRYLCDKFPNYQELWSNFIAPLTNRPNNVHPMANVDPFLEKIWASHYSLFVQLGSAYRVRSALIDDNSLMFYFETIFYHLGVSMNQQEELFFLLYSLENKIGRKNLENPEGLTLEDSIKKVKSYYKKYYRKDFKDFIESGKTVSCIFHSKNDFVSQFVKTSFNSVGQNAYKALNLIKEEIRAYRNFIEHSHQMGKILTKQGVLVPKYKFLKKYKDWIAVREAGMNNSDFVPLKELLDDILSKYTEHINRVWSHLVDKYREISEEKNYKKLIGLQFCPKCNCKLIEKKTLFTKGVSRESPIEQLDVTGKNDLELNQFSASGSAVLDKNTNISDFFKATTGISLIEKKLVCENCKYEQRIFN